MNATDLRRAHIEARDKQQVFEHVAQAYAALRERLEDLEAQLEQAREERDLAEAKARAMEPTPRLRALA